MSHNPDKHNKIKSRKLSELKRELRAITLSELKKKGYASFHNIREYAKNLGSYSDRSILRMMLRIPNTQRIFFWVDSNNEYINSLELCPPNTTAMIITRPKSLFKDIVMCQYNVSNRADYRSLLDNLERRDYKRTRNFPPALGQYFITKTGGHKYIYWSESDCQLKENAEEGEYTQLEEEFLEK